MQVLFPMSPQLQAQPLLCDAGVGLSKLHSPDSISSNFPVVSANGALAGAGWWEKELPFCL